MVLLKLLLSIVALFTSPSRGPVDPDQPYDVTPYGPVDPDQPYDEIPYQPVDPDPSYDETAYGPQSWAGAMLADDALHGHGDDIRYPEEDEPSYAGINGTQFRWPGYPGKAEIPIAISPDVAKDDKLLRVLDVAVQQIQKNTCITFVPKKSHHKQYVKIIKDGGKCYSYVGCVKSPVPQILSLGKGCEYVGTVVHELLHALGFFHEHQRFDRDKYITVHEENVKKGEMHNFKKNEDKKEIRYFDYQCESIMHYGETAFSKDPKKFKTMEAKDGKTELKEPYNKPGLTQTDIDRIKKLYKCK